MTPAAEALFPIADRSALKEWAAVEAALGSGATVLMLRKGGIYEQKLGFQVEHRRFWLFPTRFHQSADELAPSFEWSLNRTTAPSTSDGRVSISSYVEVVDALRVERFEALERLSGLHPLAAATVHARFHYKRRPYLHLLVVRVHRLGEPHHIVNHPDYDGCVSWVQLADPLPTSGLRPVLDDEAFSGRRTEVLDLLGSDGVTRPAR